MSNRIVKTLRRVIVRAAVAFTLLVIVMEVTDYGDAIETQLCRAGFERFCQPWYQRGAP